MLGIQLRKQGAEPAETTQTVMGKEFASIDIVEELQGPLKTQLINMMRVLLKGNALLHRLTHTMPIENIIAVG